MKFVLAFVSLAVLVAAAPVGRASDADESAAKAAALAWLGLVDAGNYAASWTSASSRFRQQVPEEQWRASAAQARTPLGAVVSRHVRSVTYTHSLPGAPDGEYVVIRFESSFGNKAAAIETVTPMKDVDGQWRVAGYYIR